MSEVPRSLPLPPDLTEDPKITGGQHLSWPPPFHPSGQQTLAQSRLAPALVTGWLLWGSGNEPEQGSGPRRHTDT